MGTGQKIAIGCGIAVVVAGLGIAAAVMGGLWWAKGKAEQFTGNEQRIDELKKKANAVSFKEPEDGVIAEDRLVKFLDVRRRVYAVYEKNKDLFEAMNKKKEASFSDVTSSLGVLNDVRLAQAQALADVGMSEDEYRFMVGQVYKTLWAAEVSKQTGGKSVSEATSEMFDKAADEMEKMRQAQAAASPSGSPMTKEQREAAAAQQRELDQAAADARKQATEARESSPQLDVPPQNIALFRKYEADIKKYAMGGLEFVGL